MPPKKVDVTKAPEAIKRAMMDARASTASAPAINPFSTSNVKKSELDQLLSMTPKEIYPYACFLLVIILALLYQIIPKIFAPLVEFQYLVVDPDAEEDKASNIPRFGASTRNVVNFFEVGPLDAVHLTFIFLCVVSFNVFINELWQMGIRYFLKSPKKTQDLAIRRGSTLIFHLVALSIGFGLIPEEIWTSFGTVWARNGLAISRTLKFYLLAQNAFQISQIVDYLLNTPAASRKMVTLIGNFIVLGVTLAIYFSGISLGLALALISADLASVLLEVKDLLDSFSFQKPENSIGKSLRPAITITWVVGRILVPLLLVLHYGFNVIQAKAKETGNGAEFSVSHFSPKEYALFAGVVLATIIQFTWHLSIQKKFSRKSK